MRFIYTHGTGTQQRKITIDAKDEKDATRSFREITKKYFGECSQNWSFEIVKPVILERRSQRASIRQTVGIAERREIKKLFQFRWT